MKNQQPTCPCCKYQPKVNPSGSIRKGSQAFENVTVTHDYKENYTSSVTSIGLCCPNCGVIFRDLKRKVDRE